MVAASRDAGVDWDIFRMQDDKEPQGNPWMKSVMIWSGILLAMLLVASMFGGASQAMATQMWPREAWSLSLLLTIVGVVAAVNSRMFLMGLYQAAKIEYVNIGLLDQLN